MSAYAEKIDMNEQPSDTPITDGEMDYAGDLEPLTEVVNALVVRQLERDVEYQTFLAQERLEDAQKARRDAAKARDVATGLNAMNVDLRQEIAELREALGAIIRHPESTDAVIVLAGDALGIEGHQGSEP